MLIVELLRHVADGSNADNAVRVARELQQSSDREFLWAIEAGLGPLLHAAMRGCNERLPDERQLVLLSSDLTARVKHGLRVESAMEVITACATVGAPVTLLKGISISEQFYPQGHLRPMSDIDVLVPCQSYAAIEDELLRSGFVRGPEAAPEDLYHGTPLLDCNRRVWIELHRELFPLSSGLRSGTSFSMGRIAAQSLESEFHGLPVTRFSREMQLVYVATSWMRDLMLYGFHPSHVIALFDAVYLLSASGRSPDWSAVMEGLDNPMACASLHVLLNCCNRHRIGHSPMLGELATKQKLVGRVELAAMLAVLDRTLLAGREWHFILPPPLPGRYNFGSQFRKRVLRR